MCQEVFSCCYVTVWEASDLSRNCSSTAEKLAGYVSGALIRDMWINEIWVWNMGDIIMRGKPDVLEKRNPKPVPLWKETCNKGL